MYCIVYILCATSGKGRAPPLNVSNKCWGGGGRVSLGRTSREDGVGEQPPTFIGIPIPPLLQWLTYLLGIEESLTAWKLIVEVQASLAKKKFIASNRLADHQTIWHSTATGKTLQSSKTTISLNVDTWRYQNMNCKKIVIVKVARHSYLEIISLSIDH